MTMDVGIRLLHIVAVVMERMAESADMIMGVIAHLMAFINNLLIEFWIFPDIIAHHEEGGLDIELAQRLQNERRRFRDGTIIERQVDCAFVTVHSPESLWIDPA